MPVFFLSRVIVLGRASSAVLNRNNKGGHLCSVTEIRREIHSLFTLSMVLPEGVL